MIVDKPDLSGRTPDEHSRAAIDTMLDSVYPATLADAADDWSAAARTVRDLRRSLHAKATELAGAWQGKAAAQCLGSLRLLAESADRLAAHMDAIGAAVGTAADGQQQGQKALDAAEDDARQLLLDSGGMFDPAALDGFRDLTHRRSLEVVYDAYRQSVAALPDLMTYDLPGLPKKLAAGDAGRSTVDAFAAGPTLTGADGGVYRSGSSLAGAPTPVDLTSTLLSGPASPVAPAASTGGGGPTGPVVVPPTLTGPGPSRPPTPAPTPAPAPRPAPQPARRGQDQDTPPPRQTWTLPEDTPQPQPAYQQPPVQPASSPYLAQPGPTATASSLAGAGASYLDQPHDGQQAASGYGGPPGPGASAPPPPGTGPAGMGDHPGGFDDSGRHLLDTGHPDAAIADGVIAAVQAETDQAADPSSTALTGVAGAAAQATHHASPGAISGAPGGSAAAAAAGVAGSVRGSGPAPGIADGVIAAVDAESHQAADPSSTASTGVAGAAAQVAGRNGPPTPMSGSMNPAPAAGATGVPGARPAPPTRAPDEPDWEAS